MSKWRGVLLAGIMVMLTLEGHGQYTNQKIAENKEGSLPLAGPKVAISIKNPDHIAVSAGEQGDLLTGWR